MMKLNKYIFLGLALLSLFSCKKDTEAPFPAPRPLQLPEISNEGRGTFGCKINGQVWLPYGTERFPKLSAKDEGNGIISISAQQESAEYGVHNSLYINISNFSTQKEVKPGTSAENTVAYYNWQLDRMYSIYSDKYDLIDIARIDTINKIISGVFNFKLLDSKSQDTLHVTDGRFDLRYE